MDNSTMSRNEDVIKTNVDKDEVMDLNVNEISPSFEECKIDNKLTPVIKVVAENQPMIEQAISTLKEDVTELFLSSTKNTPIQIVTTSAEDKAKNYESLNNLLADAKVKALVDSIGGKEAHGILVETLDATANFNKPAQDKQAAIVNGVRKLQSSLGNDSIIDIAKSLAGLSRPKSK